VSTYELGRQPFGLASCSAFLRREGANVTVIDLATEEFDEQAVLRAGLVAFSVPMHTAARLMIPVVRRVREVNERAHLAFFGLYAPVNETFFRELGGQTILGGEFETGLASLYRRLAAGDTERDVQPEPVISLERIPFIVPDRSGLPPLERYARLTGADERERLVGYTEASRGCKHLCRHCPIPPVYEGRFRIVPRDVVLEDVRQQREAGAEHITFGDPDFLNGPGHAIPLVEEFHRRFPALTYDVTIKVEHLIKRPDTIATLKRTGCLFVTTAVESIDDEILERFDKRHSRADLETIVRSFRAEDLALVPTFVTFTPWTTRRGYIDLLEAIAELDLIDTVAPVQYAIRLLIPAGSKLLDLAEVRELVGEFDSQALCHRWAHADPGVDALYEQVRAIVSAPNAGDDRAATHLSVWEAAQAADTDRMRAALARRIGAVPRAAVPFMNEPWYC
jgi:radical SAM superfamily enzyme YgiQ (UPF0313 family)